MNVLLSSVCADQPQGDEKYWNDREPILLEASAEAKGLYEMTETTGTSTRPGAQRPENGESCTTMAHHMAIYLSLNLSYDVLRIRHQQHGC